MVIIICFKSFCEDQSENFNVVKNVFLLHGQYLNHNEFLPNGGVLIMYDLVGQRSSPKPISVIQMAEIKEHTLYVPTLNEIN